MTTYQKLYCYHKLQIAITDYIEAFLTKYYNESLNNELDKLIVTPEFRKMVDSQHPRHKDTRTYEVVCNNFWGWVADAIHPMDAFRIMNNFNRMLEEAKLKRGDEQA